ncbi:hypothetical protein G4Y79_15220 [Phototrophicus methaneseepsis]|uniref:Uncharacterized protein n=1 Tax=Phototrophicus methaneseepsis TaxID=2710758 RepID=A0A7S8E691_9CHLR|nr:hypothetical protein [Phototrophicus methaneseepsis]QPC81053.1 hypothetical protein G4Y79_15220 [Phototrophicus methaneseepsis]
MTPDCKYCTAPAQLGKTLCEDCEEILRVQQEDADDDMYYESDYDDFDPYIEHGETVWLDGFFYDVVVTVDDSMRVTIEHSPVYYSCWDGKLPF